MANPQVVTPPLEPNAKFLSPQEMNAEQLASWERTGEMVERPAKADEKTPPETPDDSAAPPADSAPAKPAEQVASTEASPEAASEPAKPEKKARGKSLTERNEHLRAEIEENTRLLKMRDEIRRQLDEPVSPKQTKPAAQSPDSAPDATSDLKKEIARIKALPGAPKIGDFEDPDDWGIALSTFVSRQLTEQAFSQYSEQTARSAEAQERIRTVGSKLEAQYQAHPELADQVDQRFLDIVPSRDLPPGQKAGPHHFIKDQILYECEHTVALGAFYSTPEGVAEMQRMFRMSPEQIIRTLAIRDHAFSTDDSQAAAVDEGAEPASPHVSKAPPPPPVAGRKTAAPSDPLQTAIKTGDFNTFDRLENERLLAKKGKTAKR